jgi:3'-phosphoadenosine 5'-phosphosulfate (PAPS) 3'-phosphatase
MNKNQESMNKIFDALRPQHISRVAGAGNKVVYMLDQKADTYINLVPGFKYWDLCAGEALVQAMMGVVTDANNQPIIYDHTKTNFTIKEGILIHKNKRVHETVNMRLM